MRALVQRVREASVRVDAREVAAIGQGLLVLVGIGPGDGDAERDWLAWKVARLRVFDDDDGVMNRAVAEIGGEVLVVSQFTLYASLRKGNRPSYAGAAPPALAQPAFDGVVAALAQACGVPVRTGVFGASMQVALVNDGPVTLWLDTAARD